jgi:autotransporter translocation and assembly factor TamB
LRSARFDLADVGGLPAARGDALKSLLSLGEFRFKDGKATLRGTLSSPEGTLRELPYHNLRGEIVWSPNSLKFRNLTFQALSGSLRADGSMESGAENSQRLVLDPKVEAVDLKALLAQKFPQFKDNFDGQLTLKAKFRTEGKNSSAAPGSVEGEGETRVRSGSLKDFNLMQLVFSRIGALPGMSNLSVPPRYLALAERRDTLFDSLTGSFEIKQGRIYSKDLLLSAADYSVSAEGSMGFDKTMKWNAVLAMSPQFSQDLVKEYKTARFLLDKQGRLTIPFRLEGALPHVQVKPDLHALGEMIRKGQLLRGSARPSMPRS